MSNNEEIYKQLRDERKKLFKLRDNAYYQLTKAQKEINTLKKSIDLVNEKISAIYEKMNEGNNHGNL